MKPFLGIDITQNQENEQTNSDELIAAAATEEQKKMLDSESDAYVGILNDAIKPPLKMRIALWVTGVLSFLSVIAFSEAIDIASDKDYSIGDIFAKVPWLFIAGGVIIITFATLIVMAVKRAKSLIHSGEQERTKQKIECIIDEIHEGFGIPDDAVHAEIMTFNYIMTDDGPLMTKEKDVTSDCYNDEYTLFTDESNLYVVNMDTKYALPLEGVKRIRKVENKLSLFSWNKDVECNKGIYKQYKMKEDDEINVIIKYYYILEIEVSNETWGVYIPPYELEVFESLVGIKAE